LTGSDGALLHSLFIPFNSGFFNLQYDIDLLSSHEEAKPIILIEIIDPKDNTAVEEKYIFAHEFHNGKLLAEIPLAVTFFHTYELRLIILDSATIVVNEITIK